MKPMWGPNELELLLGLGRVVVRVARAMAAWRRTRTGAG
ncbi:MAG: hypothetical protein RL199_413 [Pseudomonadota bacterium]|jgi:hypothetical protein